MSRRPLRATLQRATLFATPRRLLLPAAVLGLALATLLLAGCPDRSRNNEQGQGRRASIVIDGFEIPVFATPNEQLRYSESFFEDPGKKRAALKAVGRTFAEQKKYCGIAALELAYLSMGEDYRLADTSRYRAAASEYRRILVEYQNYQEVSAKALWYLGWISSDLLDNRSMGLDYYREVVTRYPQVTMGFDLPIPKVRSLYPQELRRPTQTYRRSSTHWATVALVEIARLATDPEEIAAALRSLATRYHNSVATGIAIRAVLRAGKLPAGARPLVDDYIANADACPPLRRDIRNLLGTPLVFMGK